MENIEEPKAIKIETNQKNIAKKDGAKKFFECIFVLILSVLEMY